MEKHLEQEEGGHPGVQADNTPYLRVSGGRGVINHTRVHTQGLYFPDARGS